MIRILTASVLALSLSACAGGNFVRGGQTPAVDQASNTAFRAPEVMDGRGVRGIIGKQAASLTNRFGDPRIDLIEGDARKLQFASQLCVLDVFLYPMEAGQAPVATHIVTRLRKGGGQIDNTACINAVAAERRETRSRVRHLSPAEPTQAAAPAD